VQQRHPGVVGPSLASLTTAGLSSGPAARSGRNRDSHGSTSAGGSTTVISTASISDGDRKSDPEGSHRTEASASSANQRRAASLSTVPTPARRAAGSAISSPKALEGCSPERTG
jgi:hypothetical protein